MGCKVGLNEVEVVGMDYRAQIYFRGKRVGFSNWLDTEGKEERRLYDSGREKMF